MYRKDIQFFYIPPSPANPSPPPVFGDATVALARRRAPVLLPPEGAVRSPAADPRVPPLSPLVAATAALGLIAGMADALVRYGVLLYLASKSLMVSRTRDLGRGGGFTGLLAVNGGFPAAAPAIEIALSAEVVCFPALALAGLPGELRTDSFSSKRLGKEIGLGILDLELLEDLELDTVVTEPGVVASEECCELVLLQAQLQQCSLFLYNSSPGISSKIPELNGMSRWKGTENKRCRQNINSSNSNFVSL